MELVQLCIQSNFFQYQSEIYQQVTGMPMGSPISVVVAELVMQHIEKLIFENSPCGSLLWRRYVDDIITILPSTEIEEFTNYINNIHSNFKFTCEVEKDRKLPYLDVLITRAEDNNMTFSVYRKNSYSGKYLDYSSENHLS